MRVAWCTPFAPRSAIGRFSALVVTAMREALGWEVDIWYPEGTGGRTEPDAGFELKPGAQHRLAEYDAIVYNIGNHAQYHSQLVDLSASYPGVMIMHDVSLAHLMLDRLLTLPRDELAHELKRWYRSTEAVPDEILADPGGWASSAANVHRYPLSEPVTAAALGVVTHSEFAADQLRDRFAGDVWAVPLPALHFDAWEIADVELPMIDSRAVILQAGVLNANKCVDVVLAGFAEADLSDKAQLVICGFATQKDLRALRGEVRRLGLAGTVHVLGAVRDDQLHSLRRRALVATVLRNPCIEAASAVLLDSMAYGLAVVTVSTGHYVEVPNDVVVHVPTPPDPADLAAVFTRLVCDPDAAVRMGARAKSWVRERHTPTAYASAMAQVIDEAGSYPRRRQLAEQLAQTLQRAGFGSDSPVADSVAHVATELFAGQPRRGMDILFRNRSTGG